MRQIIKCSTLISLIVAALPALALADDAETYSTVRGLLLNGRAAEAQEKLSVLPVAERGLVQYGYLAGIAARDLGKLEEAQSAFLNVLKSDASHLPTRVELARVYFERGAYAAAESEFENVLRQDPPADVASNVKSFLVAISQKRQVIGSGTSWNSYIDGSLGYDTNLTQATNDKTVTLPVFNNLAFTLSDLYTKQEGMFWQVRGGTSLIRPINDTVAVFAGAGGQLRQTDVKTSVVNASLNSLSVDVVAGLIVKQGNDQWYVGARSHDFWAGKYHYLQSIGLDMSWTRPLDNTSSLSAFGSFTPQRYHNLLESNDVDQWLGGASYAKILGGSDGALFRVSGYLGNETPSDSARKEIGRNFLGLRANGEMKIAQDWSANGLIAIEQSEYSAASPIFMRTRNDTRVDLKVGLGYSGLSKNWLVSPEVTYTDNRSNIVLNTYQRATAMVTVRHDFR